jgi:hypothetical protein
MPRVFSSEVEKAVCAPKLWVWRARINRAWSEDCDGARVELWGYEDTRRAAVAKKDSPETLARLNSKWATLTGEVVA